ncbi:hypothetical protein, partial [Lactococcus petauri]|uniref:hypothetical protein n=1 Tax=Lactococcus petauri TaxID=1940789 RepID=UPI0022E8B26D
MNNELKIMYVGKKLKKTKFGIITVTFLALMIGESVNADSFYFQINEHRVTVEQENLVKDEEGNVWSRDGNIWYNQLTEEQGTLMINEDVEQKVPTPVEQKVPT